MEACCIHILGVNNTLDMHIFTCSIEVSNQDLERKLNDAVKCYITNVIVTAVYSMQ